MHGTGNKHIIRQKSGVQWSVVQVRLYQLLLHPGSCFYCLTVFWLTYLLAISLAISPQVLFFLLRTLQFNYVSLQALFGKIILPDSKKKKKVDFGVLRTKLFKKYSVRLQNI